MKQTKAKPAKKQFSPFEPEEKKKVTKVFPSKRAGSIFEKSKEDSHDEKDEWAEEHDELGETDEQTEGEMERGDATPDNYSRAGRKVLEDDEDEQEPWEEAWSQGASGKGRHGKYDEQKPSVPEKKVKETVKGLKKKK